MMPPLAVEYGCLHYFSRILAFGVLPEAEFVVIGVAEEGHFPVFFVPDIAGRDAAGAHLLQRPLQVRDRKAEASIATPGDDRSGRTGREFDEHAIEIEARDIVMRNQGESESFAIESDGCIHVADIVED